MVDGYSMLKLPSSPLDDVEGEGLQRATCSSSQTPQTRGLAHKQSERSMLLSTAMPRLAGQMRRSGQVASLVLPGPTFWAAWHGRGCSAVGKPSKSRLRNLGTRESCDGMLSCFRCSAYGFLFRGISFGRMLLLFFLVKVAASVLGVSY